MKNKFKYLVKYSLKKKINTKWFKIVNILLCLLLIFIVNMDYVINFFGGDFETKEKIYIVDNLNKYESFKNYFTKLTQELDMSEYELELDNSKLTDQENLADDVIVVLNSNTESYLTSEIISNETISRNTYDIITNTLNVLKNEIVLEQSGLTNEEITKLTSPVEVKETVLDSNATNNQTKESLSAIITTVVIVPFFILIVTMVQMLGAEINDEKTSRGMEVIISSIPAKLHFISKVLAALSYVLIQGLLLFLYVFIGIIIRKIFTTTGGASADISMISDTINMLKNAGIFDLLLKGGLVLIILFIISFIAYAIVSATLASMTTNNEDFQQLQTPLMIIMLVGYYVAFMAVIFDGSIFINILGYIPLLSVMIAPTLYLIGEFSLASLIGSTIIAGIATYFIYIYGLRIYKVGILNYSSTKLWQKMFKSLKNRR